MDVNKHPIPAKPQGQAKKEKLKTISRWCELNAIWMEVSTIKEIFSLLLRQKSRFEEVRIILLKVVTKRNISQKSSLWKSMQFQNHAQSLVGDGAIKRQVCKIWTVKTTPCHKKKLKPTATWWLFVWWSKICCINLLCQVIHHTEPIYVLFLHRLQNHSFTECVHDGTEAWDFFRKTFNARRTA